MSRWPTVAADTSHWTRENLAWLAGLIEGEGSISLRDANNVQVQVEMTDEDVVRTAYLIAGVGTFRGPKKGRTVNRKETYVWGIYRSAHIYALLVAVWPWLHARRREMVRSALITVTNV